ncbi:MAG: ABC transporter ATP-binding protein, partial [Rhodospirillales bacterium]
PTNHLDVDAREALVQGLNAYDGAVVLVSHDAHLIELICDRLWLVDEGTCDVYDGDMEDYRRLLLDRARRRRRESKIERNDGKERVDKKADRQARAQARAETAALRKRVQDAERKLEKLSERKTALEGKLADPALYEGHSQDLRALNAELADVVKAIAAAERTWIEAEEQLASV